MKKQVNPQITQIKQIKAGNTKSCALTPKTFVDLGLIGVNLRNLRTKKGF